MTANYRKKSENALYTIVSNGLFEVYSIIFILYLVPLWVADQKFVILLFQLSASEDVYFSAEIYQILADRIARMSIPGVQTWPEIDLWKPGAEVE